MADAGQTSPIDGASLMLQIIQRAQNPQISPAPAPPQTAPSTQRAAPPSPGPMGGMLPSLSDLGSAAQNIGMRSMGMSSSGATSPPPQPQTPVTAPGLSIPPSQPQPSDAATLEQMAPLTPDFSDVNRIEKHSQALTDSYDRQAQEIARQTGTALGAQHAYDLSTAEIKQTADDARAKFQDALSSLQYPGLQADEIKQLQQVINVGSNPNATSEQMRQAQAAQLQLKMGQNMPSVEPAGWNGFVNGLAMALGAIGASLAKTPNYAQQFVEEQIKREADRQEQEWKRKAGNVEAARNYYGMMHTIFEDELAVKQATQAAIYKQAGIKLDALKIQTDAGMKSDELLARAAERIATLKYTAKLKQMQTGIDISEGDRKSIEGHVGAIKAVQTLRNEFSKGNVSGVDKILGLGGTMTQAGRYNNMRDLLASEISRNIGEGNPGGKGKAIIDYVMQGIPTAGASTEGGKRQFADTLHYLESSLDTVIKGSQLGKGRDPAQVRAFIEKTYGIRAHNDLKEKLKQKGLAEPEAQ